MSDRLIDYDYRPGANNTFGSYKLGGGWGLGGVESQPFYNFSTGQPDFQIGTPVGSYDPLSQRFTPELQIPVGPLMYGVSPEDGWIGGVRTPFGSVNGSMPADRLESVTGNFIGPRGEHITNYGTADGIRSIHTDPVTGRSTFYETQLSREGAAASSIGPHWGPGRCFPAGTQVRLGDGTNGQIEDVVAGQQVAAFASDADGTGPLVPARVVRLYRNVTTEWLVLSNGLTLTPGHHVLNERGAFETIEDLLARGGRIVREDGTLEAVTAERIVYSEATRHLYEEAEEAVYAADGAAALAPEIRRGWRTYNFEVEGLHTYVAGGVRVHNESENAEGYAAMMDSDQYAAMGYDGMAAEYGPDIAEATAWGMDPYEAMALRDEGLLDQAMSDHVNGGYGDGYGDYGYGDPASYNHGFPGRHSRADPACLR